MFYGVVGPSIGKWSHTTDLFLNSDGLQDRFKIKDTGIGIAFGGGIEYLAHDKCSISLDFTQHFLKHKSKSKDMTILFRDRATGLLMPRSGTVTKNVKPSFSVVAVRLAFLL